MSVRWPLTLPHLPTAWHRFSVRRTLLTLALPIMLVMVSIESALTWKTGLQAANAAYDRSLLGAIKAIDSNVSTDTGLSVELPYRLLEFFELTASGQVFFRVSTDDGLVEIGNAGLPLPAQGLALGVLDRNTSRSATPSPRITAPRSLILIHFKDTSPHRRARYGDP